MLRTRGRGPRSKLTCGQRSSGSVMASRLSRSVRDSNAQTLRTGLSESPRPAVGWRPRGARLFSLVLSAAILAALYRSIDVRLIVRDLRSVDGMWVVVAVGIMVPRSLLRAARFR